jgi:hypothetical protein
MVLMVCDLLAGGRSDEESRKSRNAAKHTSAAVAQSAAGMSLNCCGECAAPTGTRRTSATTTTTRRHRDNGSDASGLMGDDDNSRRSANTSRPTNTHARPVDTAVPSSQTILSDPSQRDRRPMTGAQRHAWRDDARRCRPPPAWLVLGRRLRPRRTGAGSTHSHEPARAARHCFEAG